jgi:hypothetical protein
MSVAAVISDYPDPADAGELAHRKIPSVERLRLVISETEPRKDDLS